MEFEIIYNRKGILNSDDIDLLYQLGAEKKNNSFYKKYTIEEISKLNTELHKLTNSYWNVIVGIYLDEPKIFIELDNDLAKKEEAIEEYLKTTEHCPH